VSSRTLVSANEFNADRIKSRPIFNFIALFQRKSGFQSSVILFQTHFSSPRIFAAILSVFLWPLCKF
jgi:hypothetical protein